MNPRTRKENLLLEIFRFFRHLNFSVSPSTLPFKAKIVNILKIVGWLYLVLIPVGIIINVVLIALKYKGANDVETLIKEVPTWYVIILGAVVAPFLEEITFRLSLRFRPIYFALTSVFASFYLSGYVFTHIGESIRLFLLLRVLLPVCIGLVVYIAIRLTPLKRHLAAFYERFFVSIFYTSVILFGLIHISNYTEWKSVFFLLPLLVFPQIIVGFLLGYVRIKYGFRYSYLLHGVFNGALMLPTSLAITSAETSPLVAILGCWILLILGFGLVTFLIDFIRLFTRKPEYV